MISGLIENTHISYIANEDEITRIKGIANL